MSNLNNSKTKVELHIETSEDCVIHINGHKLYDLDVLFKSSDFDKLISQIIILLKSIEIKALEDKELEAEEMQNVINKSIAELKSYKKNNLIDVHHGRSQSVEIKEFFGCKYNFIIEV